MAGITAEEIRRYEAALADEERQREQELREAERRYDALHPRPDLNEVRRVYEAHVRGDTTAAQDARLDTTVLDGPSALTLAKARYHEALGGPSVASVYGPKPARADWSGDLERLDRSELRRPERHPSAYLRVDAHISRAGVFVYRNPDGTERREYRPPEEVFKADSLRSFELLPLTNEHPAIGLLSPANARDYQVGTVGQDVRKDGEFIRASLVVTDGDTIADLESGKVELSCGYVCDLEESSGVTPEGERFDCIQRDVRGNHVALVSTGRAGRDVRVRMDDPKRTAQPVYRTATGQILGRG